MSIPTPHIEAKAGHFAETVLMPGDPLRAKFIAETFLEDLKEVNKVRNMFGYTGSYKGKSVSVMGSGMGIPSISIYAKELYAHYGVQNIIRVGSCGAVDPKVKVRDVIIGMGACTDSGVNRQRFMGFDFAAIADYRLLKNAVTAAEALGINPWIGNLFSADLFYPPIPELFDRMEAMRIYGVEMEAAGLYGVAAECGTSALAVCTVSDQIRTGEKTTSEERQTTFTDMMKLTLESLLLD
jgi:purine-nucleoside phosphorylase